MTGHVRAPAGRGSTSGQAGGAAGGRSAPHAPRTAAPEGAAAAWGRRGEDGEGAQAVAALFCCASGPYAALGVQVFDLARDARTFALDRPVVAHPPCRSWGRLRHLAKPRADERDLAIWAMWVVRHCGGVLEHPASSGLWGWFGLRPGRRDAFGGLLTVVDQCAFGHRAQKRTGLYCVGCEVRPAVDWGGRLARVPVERMCRAERERTPVELARVLVAAASSCAPQAGGGFA